MIETIQNAQANEPELIFNLRPIAPAIAISIEWEQDNDARWDIDDPDMDPEDFTAWQSTVKAQAIVAGRIVTGSAHLAGTWEKYGDHPKRSNPEISGYLPQMIEEALLELKAINPTLDRQINDAVKHIYPNR